MAWVVDGGAALEMEFRNFKFSTQRCIESDYSRYTVVGRQVGTVKVKVSTIQFNNFHHIIFYSNLLQFLFSVFMKDICYTEVQR